MRYTWMLFCLAATLSACSQKDDPKAVSDEMVRMAKEAAQQDSEYTADSVALAKTFETKTTVDRTTMSIPQEDEDGNVTNFVYYYLKSTDGKVCQVQSKVYLAWKSQDTLTCQWSDKYEN